MTARRSPPPARVMVVDDDLRYGEWLRHHLDVLCPEASVSMLNREEFSAGAHLLRPRLRPADARGRLRREPRGPAAHGLTLLRRLREQPATPAVIALAEEGNELTAVRALQLGAVDYLPKRLLTPERLSTAVRVALRRVERRVARRLASLANLSRDAELDGANAAENTAAPLLQRAAGPAAAARTGADAAGEALQPSGVAALLTAERRIHSRATRCG